MLCFYLIRILIMSEFILTKGDFIELIQLLKVMKIAYSGAEAKMMVEDGLVKLNGVVEYRKRAKIRVNDIVEVMEQQIKIITEPE